MKKRGILNSDIAREVSLLGHTDLIMIADCGLPIPEGVKRIDLSIIPGTPNFKLIYDLLLKEVFVEEQIIADEMIEENFDLYKCLDDKIDIKTCSHEELKLLSKDCKFIIRTGENTPYGNIILKCGVDFEELNENSSI